MHRNASGQVGAFSCSRRWSFACVVALLALDAVGAQCPAAFSRGDVDADGRINVTDPVIVLSSLFTGEATIPCEDAADTNDDGVLNITDAVFGLNFLFTGSTDLPPPFAGCGIDPTVDALSCDSFPACGKEDRSDANCNGVDDDCDGEIDEDLDVLTDVENCGECGADCEDLGWENVRVYVCLRGECLIGECADGFFDLDGIAENGCEAALPPDHVPCDDGNPCTTGDRVLGGLCGGRPRDCSAFSDPCNIGVCDPDTGDCVRVPRPGRACDDGDPDTASDRCSDEGVCEGIRIR